MTPSGVSSHLGWHRERRHAVITCNNQLHIERCLRCADPSWDDNPGQTAYGGRVAPRVCQRSYQIDDDDAGDDRW